MPGKIKYIMMSTTIAIVLHWLFSSLPLVGLSLVKFVREIQFSRNLEADGECIAQRLWDYHSKHGQYPKDLTEIEVQLRVSNIREWNLSIHPEDIRYFSLIKKRNGSKVFTGESRSPMQVEWSWTTMH